MIIRVRREIDEYFEVRTYNDQGAKRTLNMATADIMTGRASKIGELKGGLSIWEVDRMPITESLEAMATKLGSEIPDELAALGGADIEESLKRR